MSATNFSDLRDKTRELLEIIKPPRRISVSESAEESVVITAVGGVNGPWNPAVTPYMIEPMNTLSSRLFTGVVFAGPARSGKTQSLVDCFIAYSVTASPADMMLLFPTERLAYDFSKRRLRRLNRDSPVMASFLSDNRHDNAVGTIIYRHGMMLNTGWPTSSQVAQRDIRNMAISDYDSMPDDVDGEGEVWGVAQKRTQQFGSAGMTVAESSPKRPIIKSTWEKITPHEAPPTAGGVLSLYNRGDRRLWFWQCNHCSEWFECPALPSYEDKGESSASSKTAFVACPSCGGIHHQKDKRDLNISGKWLREGEYITPDGTISGTHTTPKTASFWLKGCAASFQTWEELLFRYLSATEAYARTGEEAALITTHNVDQGVPYLPMALRNSRSVDDLVTRQTEANRKVANSGVRFIVTAVDVQSNRFEVLVTGYGVDLQSWIIDRYKMGISNRTLSTGEADTLDPAGHAEDWDVLTPLIDMEYEVEGSSSKLKNLYLGVDYGGQKGVHSRSLAWWRRVRKAGKGSKTRLVRGEGRAFDSKIPRVRETYPDTTSRKKTISAARGDVPILALHVNAIKDAVFANLNREEIGPGYIHLPEWLKVSYLEEVVSEIRGEKMWECPRGQRNETWDLMVYSLAIAIFLGADSIDWTKPPKWARGNSVHHKKTKRIPIRQEEENGFYTDTYDRGFD